MVSRGIKQNENHAVAVWKMEIFFDAKKQQSFIVWIYKKNLFGFKKVFKDSHVNLSYFFRSYTPVIGKEFLQSSQNIIIKLFILVNFQSFLSCVNRPVLYIGRERTN